MKLLSGRRYTKVALDEKLRALGYAREAVDDALHECERRRYLDDRTFAALYVKGVLDRKPVGRLRLVEELIRRGVDQALAAEVVDAADGGEDERIDRAIAKCEVLRPHEGAMTLARRLERLGFDAPAIARALRRRASARGAFPDESAFDECR